MKQIIRLFFILAMMLTIFNQCSTKVDKNAIIIDKEHNKLDIYFQGKLRLSGGSPMIQSKSLKFTKVTSIQDKYAFQTSTQPLDVIIKTSDSSDLFSFFLTPNSNNTENGSDFLGFFFDQIPEYKIGVSIWRYKPWNSWSKPIRIDSIQQLESWDIQFFYWQYADGLYGAAMPLCGKGYRTTLGQENGRFGAKAISYYNGMKEDSIPQLTIGFGNDPYKLFTDLYEEGMKQMGMSENLRKNKTYPPILENIGWCTWNSSDMGRLLNEKLLLDAAKYFKSNKFPMGWMLIDDGWFDNSDSRLNGYFPDKLKFPRGFKPVVNELKSGYGIKNVGIWHAFNGYWNGINPDSPLGKQYKNDLYSWQQKERPDLDSAAIVTYYFIKPNSPALFSFYDEFHAFMKREGLTFVKVDNQLVAERMCVSNYPIFDLSKLMHEALNKSIFEKFDGTIINCMDMTAEAYYNFGKSAIARTVEDYFEYTENENYNLQKGNAAAHVVQAIYNSLYFSQMVFTDFDMFQSHNPNAEFHAIARALSGGPIYLTDRIGQSRFDVLTPLIYSDGRIIRSPNPLLPTEDCLFQVLDAKPLKAFSLVGSTGLLGIWNAANADKVEGSFKPSDVHGITGEQFGVYEYFSKELVIATHDQLIPVAVNRLGYKLYYVVPLIGGNGVLGLVNKYNAPATIVTQDITSSVIKAVVPEGGVFGAIVQSKPKKVSVNGENVTANYNNHLLTIEIPMTEKQTRFAIEIQL